MVTRHGESAGFSLIELLIVISLMAIMAGLVLPSSSPSIHDQLRSAARIVATDLAYGRSLAVTNNSNYKFTFDTADNRYVLEHNGTDPDLDTLPDSPFRNADDPPEQHIVDLDNLPRVGAPVELAAVASTTTFLEPVTDLEFGPLGETTRSGYTILWLSAGNGSAKRYIWLLVNPITGLTTIGDYTAYGPPAWL